MKKVLTNILAIALICVITVTSMGAYGYNHLDVDVLSENLINEEADYKQQKFHQITKEIAKYCLHNNFSNSKSFDEDYKLLSLENKLNEIGARRLSYSEVMEMSDQRIATSDTVVGDHVAFYNMNYTYVVDAQTYEIEELMAVGTSLGGTLVTGKDNEEFYSGQSFEGMGAFDVLLEIYINKAISMIPIIKWMPYELLTTTANDFTRESLYLSHRQVSRINCYTERKEGSSWSRVSLYTNAFDMKAQIHGIMVADGQISTYYDEKSSDASSDYFDSYNSAAKAIEFFKENRTIYDYLHEYKIDYKYDNTIKTKRYSLPNPSAPGLIY